MKKLFIIILLLFLNTSFVLADDISDTTDASDSWSSMESTIDKGFDGQKAVSDELFNKTIEDIKNRKGGKKRKKNEIKPLSPVPMMPDQYDNVELQSLFNNIQDTPTIMFPTTVISTEGNAIPAGYYKLSTKKFPDNNYYFELSQGNQVIAKIQALQTSEDLDDEKINYIDVSLVGNNKYYKITYASLDLTLQALVQVKEAR